MRGHRRLRSLQRAAESEFTLTLTWFSPGEKTTGADGMERPAPVFEDITTGKAQAVSQLPGNDTVSKTVKIGGSEVPVIFGGIHIPVGALFDENGALRVKVGWECQVTATGDHDDPALYGRQYRVVDVPVKSYATARRLDVVDVTHLELAGAVDAV